MIEIPKEEVGKMNRKLMVLGIAAIVSVAIALTTVSTLSAQKKPEIPFVGMSMTYYAVDWNGNTELRTVSVLRYDSATNCVTIRDSQDGIDFLIVNVGTREVVWHSGSFSPEPFYVEYWIPTNIGIGSHVNILDYDAVVTGSAVLSVEGNLVNAWQLKVTYTSGDGATIYGQVSYYYEKRTGLWVGAAWVEWDEDGMPIRNWGGHLASTNVAL